MQDSARCRIRRFTIDGRGPCYGMKWRRVRRFNWIGVSGKGNGYRLRAGMTEWESYPATPLGPCLRRDDGVGTRP